MTTENPGDHVTGPAASTLASVGQDRWHERLKNWLWGYDFFISYHWASGGTYAINLAQRLRERDYDVFLDRAEYAVGDEWKGVGETALRNTQRLVLIATREAVFESKPVEHEVVKFTDRSRHCIPIFFGDTFAAEEQANPGKFVVLDRLANDALYIEDTIENLCKGPVLDVVDKLAAAHGIMRRRRLRQSITLFAVSLLVAFSCFATVSWINALFARDYARVQEGIAIKKKEEADEQREIAKKNERETKLQLARNELDLAARNFEDQSDVAAFNHLLTALANSAGDTRLRQSTLRLIGTWKGGLGDRLFHGSSSPSYYAFSPLHQLLLIAGEANGEKLYCWDIRNRRLAWQRSITSRMTALTIDEQLDLVLYATDDEATVLTMKGGSQLQQLKAKDVVEFRVIDERQILTVSTEAGEDYDLHVWTMGDDEPSKVASVDSVRDVAVAADCIAVGGERRTLRFFPLSNEIAEWLAPAEATISISTMAVSPRKPNEIAVGGWSDRIQIWDTAAQSLKADIKLSRNICRELKFSPTGEFLVAMGNNSGANTDTAPLLRVIDGESYAVVADHTIREFADELFFNSRGDCVVALAGQTSIVDLKTGDVTDISDVDGTVDFLAARPKIAAQFPLTRSNEIRLYDHDGATYSQVLHHNPGSSMQALFWADRNKLLTVGSDRSLRIWDMEKSEPAFHCETRGADAIRDVTPQGEILVTDPTDTEGFTRCRFIRLKDGKHLASLKLEGNPRTPVVFSPSGKKIAIPTDDDRLVCVDVQRARGNFTFHVDELGKLGEKWVFLHWLADDKRLLVAQDNGARIMDVTTREEVWLTQLSCDTVTVSDDGRLVAGIVRDGDNSRFLRVWDANTGMAVEERNVKANGVLSFSQGEPRYLFFEEEYSVGRAYDLRSKRLVPHKFRHDRSVVAFALSPQNWLATSSYDGFVKFWNVDTGKELRTPINTGGVGVLRFNSSGDVLLASSSDGLRFWDAYTGHALGRPLMGAGRWLRFLTEDREQFIVASVGHNHVVAWRLPEIATASQHEVATWYQKLSTFGPDSLTSLVVSESFSTKPVAGF